MRRKPEGWNIVLAGFWNRMIFTPEWVAERIFNGEKFETYVTLLPVLPVVFKGPSVSMEVSLARLLFRPQKLNDDGDLSRAEGMAKAVLKALPETPVQAVGINFSYIEDFPPDHLKGVFHDNDPTDLGTFGWVIKERKIARLLTQGNDSLNLTLTYNDKVVTFDLNYHSDAASNEAAILAVKDGRVSALKRQGIELLRGAFHLELEEDGDDDND